MRGGRSVERTIDFYNLDLIISVGYRVKSKEATQFRIWATQILKDCLLKGVVLNQRMNRIENVVENMAEKVIGIEINISSALLPQHGIFYEGQVFDAYVFLSKIIKKAKNTIHLLDNYIDESTIALLAKREMDVNVILLTQVSSTIQLDVKKAIELYGDFILKEFRISHDRFIVIDKIEVYHIDASLKDLGKKWFAFSKMGATSVECILNKILTI